MTTYAANTVMAAGEASAVGCNFESGSGAGGVSSDGEQQHLSATLPIGGSNVPSSAARKMRHGRTGGNLATLALIVAVLALAVAVSK